LPAWSSTVSTSYYLNRNNIGLPDDNYVQVTISENGDDINFFIELIGNAFPVLGPNFGMDKFFFNYDTDTVSVNRANIRNRNPLWRARRARRAEGFGRYKWMLKGNGRIPKRCVDLFDCRR
jgi:hypothetical protein